VASPGAWRAFRLFFLGLAVLDLLLPLFLIPSGVTGFEQLGIGTYAQPRFFQLCVAAFLIQYVYIQYTAFRDPRAHATCVTLTLFIRLTFPIMYTSAIIVWGEPWSLIHTMFAAAAAGDVASAIYIIWGMRRFGLKLWQGDAEAIAPAPDSTWLRRILLVLAIAEFSISWNWMLAPKFWMTMFEVPFTVDPFWTRATGAFLLNIALIQFLAFIDINRYRTAVITSGVFRALWPLLYWYWAATGEGNFLFKLSITFFSFFDLISCITIFVMLHRSTSKGPRITPQTIVQPAGSTAAA